MEIPGDEPGICYSAKVAEVDELTDELDRYHLVRTLNPAERVLLMERIGP